MYMERAIELKKAPKQKVKYKKGQVVRIQYKRGPFTRGYDEQVGSQRYVIKRIDSKSRRYPLYYLEDERGQELAGGAFLQSQLVGISLDGTYRGRAEKYFTKGGKKYARMKWKGYDSTWDSDILV